jgi:hypothetical protein
VAAVEGGRVFFTQPADRKAFAKRLDKLGRLHAQVSGWTVYASNAALLDAVRHRRASLRSVDWYRAASAALPSGAALREVRPGWRAVGLSLHQGNAELVVHERLTAAPRAAQSSSALAHVVPADAFVAAGAANLAAVPASAPSLLRELARAVGGPLVGWVRPGPDLPEVTFVGRPAAPARALRATGALVARLTKNPSAADVVVGGRRVLVVPNGAVDVYYGLVSGRLVLTDSSDAFARVVSPGASLALVRYMPAAVGSWATIDPATALPVAGRFSGLLDFTVPPRTAADLARLRDVLRYTTRRGRVTTTVTRVDLRLHP